MPEGGEKFIKRKKWQENEVKKEQIKHLLLILNAYPQEREHFQTFSKK
jgi:hypothetical protein